MRDSSNSMFAVVSPGAGVTKPSRVESRSSPHSHADAHGIDTGAWAQVNANVLPPDQRVAAQLERVMKGFFETAAGVVEEGSPAMAEKLRRATPYWMCHMHPTHLLKSGAELTKVRDNLRHESLAATSMYPHVDDARRAKQIDSCFNAG